MRAIAALAFALGGAAVLGGLADAHATYVRSNPAADARLVRPPTEVRVAFSEPPDVSGSDVAVLDAAGRRLDRRDVRRSDEENGLVVSLAPIGDSGYIVAWTVLSTVDGHTTRGSFAFAVGDAPLPALAEISGAADPPSALEVAGRALSFAGIALLVGVPLFGLLVSRADDAWARRREAQLLAVAGGALVLGVALLLAAQGGRLPQRLGLLLGLRALAGLGALAATRLPARREVALACGLAAAASATLVSHAAALGSVRDVALDYAHVLAISAWLGGIAALLWTVLPRAGARDEREARALGALVRRFSLLAIASVATLIATGTLQAFSRLALVQDLVETPYGLALLAKIALLSATLILGGLNLLVWGPRLRAARDGLASRRGLLRGTLGESVLLAAVLVAAALLTAFVPPAQPSGAGFDQTQHVGGLRLQLLLATTSPGRNRYVLRVHEGLRPVDDASKVALRFTMVEMDMGENELVAAQRAPGEYVAQGSLTVMFGTWRVEAIVRRADRDDVRTVFAVPIAPPPGQQATARALPAGAYTLIASLDPSAPAAGAPFTLYVVIVDREGNPVPAKTLRATLAGPAAAGPLSATEAAPGVHVFTVAALDAGTWQATIAVGDEASAAYGFTVAR